MIGANLTTEALRCSGCGAENGPRAKFCNECGSALPLRDGQTSDDLAERKFLTILFADIRNSTSLIRDLDPEDARATIRPVIDMMTRAVREAGGTVNRVQGDGVMALFGAPLAVDDHALRACSAALSMRNRVSEQADPKITVRVGIHSGEVVAHFDARDLARTYDVTGRAAHFAARLEQEADRNAVLISNETWVLVRGAVQARPRRGLSFKGFDHMVDAWELTGLGQRSRWLARQASGLSPFVGRETQLADLRSRLALARTGTLQLLAIGGQPGTGKSRLLHELVGGETPSGWVTWEANCDVTVSRTPFAVLRQLLRAWLGVNEAATRADVLDALQAALVTVELPTSGRAALAALLNLGADDTAWSEMDPPVRNRLIEVTLAAVLDAMQRVRPVLLSIEDFHWADVESRDLLLKLPDRLPGGRVAVVVTHRPMVGLPDRDDRVLPTTLEEFPSQAAERFLDGLLGGHPSVQVIKLQLLDATGHLPFFLEEAVRHLVETGKLAGPSGARVATNADLRVVMPHSAQGVAAARVDALPPALRTLVRSAAAIGKRFPRALLADVASLESVDVVAAVRELAVRHIVFAGGDDSDDFVEFRHEFIREAAYGTLLRDRRQALHHAILEAIELRFGDRLADWTAALAHHAARAQMWEKAIDYERKTAASALEASSYVAASSACRRALEHIEQVPRTRAAIEQAIDIRLTLRVAVAATSELSEWLRYVDEAAALASEIGDGPRRLQASIQRAWALNFAARPRGALEEIAVAIAIARSAGAAAEPALATAQYVAGQAHYAAGEYREALEALAPATAWLSNGRESMRLGSTGTLSVACHVMRTTALASLGNLEEAEASASEAWRICSTAKRNYDLALATYGRGFLRTAAGRPAESIDDFRAALAYCEAAGVGNLVPLITTHLGAALLLCGRFEVARATLEKAIDAAQAAGHEIAEIAAYAFLSGAILAAADVERAQHLARIAHDRAKERGLRGIYISACRALAASYASPTAFAPERALSFLCEAEMTARVLGAQPAIAACISAQARLHQRLGCIDIAASLTEGSR